MKTKKGFALIEGTVIVAVLALLGIIAIPKFERGKINNNEAQAQKILKKISIACENYGKANRGVYPRDIPSLTAGSPQYLNEDYTDGTKYGYVFTYSVTDTGYAVTAKPASCGITGNHIYAINTGGILASSECTK